MSTDLGHIFHRYVDSTFTATVHPIFCMFCDPSLQYLKAREVETVLFC